MLLPPVGVLVLTPAGAPRREKKKGYPLLSRAPNPRRTRRGGFPHPSRAGLPARRVYQVSAFPEQRLTTFLLQWQRPIVFPAHGCEDSAGLSPDFPFTRDGQQFMQRKFRRLLLLKKDPR